MPAVLTSDTPPSAELSVTESNVDVLIVGAGPAG
jgi:ribulose 1,5-bisphosphate synthetase/thiazole synthase